MGKISAKIALTRWLRSIVSHAMKSLLGQYRDLHLVSLPSPLFLMTEVEKSVDRHLQGEHHLRHFGQNRLSSHFPARQNGAESATHIFPLAETTQSAPRAFSRSPKQRGARHAHFSARQNNAESPTRIFPLPETMRRNLRIIPEPPKSRRNTHAGFSYAPKQQIRTVNSDKSII